MPISHATLTANLLAQALTIEFAPERVYALWDGSYLKIGKVTTQHPTQRMRNLQTGNPRQLRLVAWTASITEREVHRRLSPYRLRGEWFRPVRRVCDEVSSWTWCDNELLARVQ